MIFGIIGWLILGAIALITCAVIMTIKGLTFKSLANHIREKIKQRKLSKNKKVLIASMKEMIDEKMRQKDPISCEELEKMGEETPYMVFEYDEKEENVDDFERIKYEQVDPRFVQKMKEEDGLIVINA